MWQVKTILLIAALSYSFALAVITHGQVPSSTPRSKLMHLEVWDGKCPNSDSDPSKGFFSLSEIRQPLLKFLNRRDFNRLVGKSGHVGAHAIKVRDGYLFVDNCEYHCCSCRSSLLVIDLHNGSMYAFFVDVRDGTQESVRWFSSQGKKSPFPKELCRFVEMGVPSVGCKG